MHIIWQPFVKIILRIVSKDNKLNFLKNRFNIEIKN